MSEYPHYHVWLHNNGDFALPNDLFAAIHFATQNGGETWVPYLLEYGPKAECIFRHLQTIKHLDRSRQLPTSIVARLSSTDDYSDYARFYISPSYGGWSNKIDWHTTIKVLLKDVRERYPFKVCGYDGPQTQS